MKLLRIFMTCALALNPIASSAQVLQKIENAANDLAARQDKEWSVILSGSKKATEMRLLKTRSECLQIIRNPEIYDQGFMYSLCINNRTQEVLTRR